jgi:hypothetical protein
MALGNPIDLLKDKVDSAMTDLKSELGQLLSQPARIKGMKPGGSQQNLLTEQTDLEQRAAAMLVKASNMSSVISQFNPWSATAYLDIAKQTPVAMSLATSLRALREEMALHIARVDSALGVGPTTTPAPSPAKTPWLMYAGAAALPLGIIAVAALAYRRRRRGRGR